MMLMWNPFSRVTAHDRESGPAQHISAATASSDSCEGDSEQYNPDIAEVEMMGSIAVVTLTTSELCQQRGAVALADLLDHIVNSGARHMVLDIQNVQYMDSACIGCMVEALNRLARSGGRIALANPGASVANLFRITRLDRVFPICADTLAAINAVERALRPG